MAASIEYAQLASMLSSDEGATNFGEFRLTRGDKARKRSKRIAVASLLRVVPYKVGVGFLLLN
jgi:hypothetical protein